MQTRPETESENLAAWARHDEIVAQRRRPGKRPSIWPIGGRRPRLRDRALVLAFVVVGFALIAIALWIL